MYYKPKYFIPEEIFPESVVRLHTFLSKGKVIVSEKIWRLVDSRVLITLDRLRDRFGTIVVNDYRWGGKNQYRGYRPALDLIDKYYLEETGIYRPKWSSFTSQHCFGRAIDCKFKYKTSQEVRDDIKKNFSELTYQDITAIEESVDWFHFDVRSWDRKTNGILFFRP